MPLGGYRGAEYKHYLNTELLSNASNIAYRLFANETISKSLRYSTVLRFANDVCSGNMRYERAANYGETSRVHSQRVVSCSGGINSESFFTHSRTCIGSE